MRVFLLFALCTLLCGACTQHSIKDDDLLLSLNFDINKKLFYAEVPGNKLEFSEGIKGKGLFLGGSHFNSTFKNVDTTLFSNDKDFSVAVWVKSSEIIPDTTIILSNSDFRKMDMGIYGKRRTNKGITLYAANGAWGWNIGNGHLHYLYEPISKDQPIADNQWHHLAFTYNSHLKEVRLFYDGINKAVLKVGDLDGRNFRSSLPLQIGSIAKNSPLYKSFNGTIDELNIWATILSKNEIASVYTKYRKLIVEPELEKDFFTVVNWNIWHGGTHFTKEKDGFDGIERITELIEKAGADIVLMQETYGAGSQISSSLGFYYYEASSTIGAVWGANLSVMSRYPIEDAFMIEERSNYGKNYAFNNGGAKIRLAEDRSVIAFSNWYNGRKPEDLEGALTAWSNLIDDAENIPIVYGGDFNSVSHLDDGEGKSGHSRLMTEAGFIDTYRELFPDAKSHPGYTAGRFEDRIDYIYYRGTKLDLLEAGPIVPNFKGKEDKTPGYPSDHLGIVARFKVHE